MVAKEEKRRKDIGGHVKKRWKAYCIFITCVAILSTAAFAFLFFRGNYDTKLLVKLGLKDPVPVRNYALIAWENCLDKLDYDADVVFLGDSIIRGSDFAPCFPEQKVVNMGLAGDTLAGMTNRISLVQTVSPEKIFVMGGINSLTEKQFAQNVEQYTQLVTGLQETMPDAEIYIQSVLPVLGKHETVCSNETIIAFNEQLQLLAQQKGCVYIDLFSVYQKDGKMNPVFSEDGIHLKPESYSLWAEAIDGYVTG